MADHNNTRVALTVWYTAAGRTRVEGSPDEFALKNIAESGKGASDGMACGRLRMPSFACCREFYRNGVRSHFSTPPDIISLIHFLAPTPATRERARRCELVRRDDQLLSFVLIRCNLRHGGRLRRRPGRYNRVQSPPNKRRT